MSRGVYRTNVGAARTSRRPLTKRLVSRSFHSRTVPAASGAAGPDAQRAAGAGPAAAASQQHRRCKQFSRESPGQHAHAAAVWPPALSDHSPPHPPPPPPPLRVWPTLWTRPAPSSPPPPSSPLTNCSLSKPRRSSAPEAESTVSSPPQVCPALNPDPLFKRQPAGH